MREHQPPPRAARWGGVLRTKDLDRILAAAGDEQHSLKRQLGPVHVTLLGIGAIIGAGIFATIGTAAAGDLVRPGAGPSLMLSFVITGAVCALTALCYAEFASLVPISGSAYTYSYATLGELVAWIIGWDLIIEYAVGNVAVAISWANYFRAFLETLGINVPLWLAVDYRSAAKIPGLLAGAPHLFGVPIVFNVLAFFIVGAITVVLVWGIRESARANALMVVVKLLVLVFFMAVALSFTSTHEIVRNWHPFQPQGWKGTLTAAAIVFFAYIGFDAVSTVAEETRNPSRDLPIGILSSLAVCTALYVAVAAVFTGILPYPELVRKMSSEQAEPLTLALKYIAPHARWAGGIVALGSVVAHTAVLLVFQLGQPRIFFSMARDGLLPPTFARVHPKFRTPHVTTIVTGLAVGILAGVASIDEMVDLTNIGTLFAFVLVCAGIPVLRRRDPDRERPFRVPFGPYLVPSLGVVSCLFLMVYLPPTSWWRFVSWLTLGLSIYVSYGYFHSGLGRTLGREARAAAAQKTVSFGLVASAVGMFFLPHDVRLDRIPAAVFASGGGGSASGRFGVILLAAGLAVAATGAAMVRHRRGNAAPLPPTDGSSRS